MGEFKTIVKQFVVIIWIWNFIFIGSYFDMIYDRIYDDNIRGFYISEFRISCAKINNYDDYQETMYHELAHDIWKEKMTIEQKNIWAANFSHNIINHDLVDNVMLHYPQRVQTEELFTFSYSKWAIGHTYETFGDKGNDVALFFFEVTKK